MTRARELADLLTGGQTITTADNTAQLTLESTDADASVGPLLDMIRDSASPADSDTLGRLRFRGDNDAGEAFTYGTITSKITDASDGTEGGLLTFLVGRNGSVTSALDLNETETVFNEGSLDADFRVESNGNANMLFVDAGNDRVGIGTNAPAHNVEIVATAAGSVNDSLQIRNNATSNGTGSRIRFINSTDNTSDANGASISSVRNGDDNDLVFETENATRMTIDHAGDMGIGTSSITNTSNYRNIHIEGTTGTIMRFMADGTQVGQIQSDTNEFQLNAVTSDPMIFKTANTERLRILSGGGLTFNGDTAAANALDDYEEGLHVTTATPNTSGSITLSSGSDTLAYTKIGRLVHISGEVSISSISSPVGSVVDFTVPFACSSLSETSERSGGGVFWTDNGTGYFVLPAFTFSGAIIRIFKDASAFSVNDALAFGFSYITDS